jgi:hypothetical protein
MAKNFLELKKKAQKNLRVLDVLITIASFIVAIHLYIKDGFSGWFWFWLVFAVVSLIMVIKNPVEKVEKKLMGSIVKGRK